MSAEELFLRHLGLIEKVTAHVCRIHHVTATEAEDFAAQVKFKLIEGNYAILRKFEGRSTLATYLTTVIERMFYQHRVNLWGKWRPSAKAKRLGDKGVTVERLISRDGYSLPEVVQMLTTGNDAAFTRPEIEAIYRRLPPRLPRPVLVSDTGCTDVPSEALQPEEEMLRQEMQEGAREATAALDALIEQLEDRDRIIVKMRYWHQKKVPIIARAVGMDTKKLYRRIERVKSILRAGLERAGFGMGLIEKLLNCGDREVQFTGGREEKASPRSSNDGEDEREDGKSRKSG